MTLNGHFAHCFKIHASFGRSMKIDPHCQRQRCSAMTVVSGNITFMRIFVGFLRRTVKRNRKRRRFFRAFGRYVWIIFFRTCWIDRSQQNIFVSSWQASCFQYRSGTLFCSAARFCTNIIIKARVFKYSDTMQFCALKKLGLTFWQWLPYLQNRPIRCRDTSED